jgi:hypothetical protein
MTDPETIARVLEAGDARRADRRNFLRSAGVAGLAIGGSSLLAACGSGNQTKAPTPTPTVSPTPSPSATVVLTDADILNFALNLEYLEANFYLWAAFGAGLDTTLTDGSGTAGTVTGGKKATLSDPIAQYAREIASDERAHVTFLRTQLGTAKIAQPAIDISAAGAFTAAARAAGVVGSGATFDPYASDENFLLAAFLLEDVGPTAYRGAIAYLSNPVFIEAAAGIHAAEAYHAGLIRSTLYAKGIETPAPLLIQNAGKISDARDALDGSTDDDQGIATDLNGASNIVPTDANGLTFARTPAQVLNIAYLSSTSVSKGGFFPNGVNGTVTSS